MMSVYSSNLSYMWTIFIFYETEWTYWVFLLRVTKSMKEIIPWKQLSDVLEIE